MAKNEAKRFFQLVEADEGADLYIFGDICSWAWPEYGEQSGVTIVQQLKDLDVENINVHINSYGGDVAEGLAIYNVLREHKAKITTICDGFACSAASVVFMAGDQRIMRKASLLMIHNAWTWVMGNANELRKAADDIETITQASVAAYKDRATISEEEIKELMDNETWILPEDAKAYGFATDIDDDEEEDGAQQSAFRTIMEKLTMPEAHEATIELNWEPCEEDIESLASRIAEKIAKQAKKKDTEKKDEPAEPKEPDKKPPVLNSGWDRYFSKGEK